MGVSKLEKKLLLSLSEFICQSTDPRESAEIYFFGVFLRQSVDLFVPKTPVVKKNILFISATNSGSIAVLAILVSVLFGHETYVRKPSRGFGKEIDTLLSLVIDSRLFVNPIRIVEHQEAFISGIEYDICLAWGSSSTLTKIQQNYNAHFKKFVSFGSRVAILVLDLKYLEVAKNSDLMCNSIITDILLFNQNACTSTKHVCFINVSSSDQNEVSSFFSRLEGIAKKSSHSYLDSLQTRLSNYFKASPIVLDSLTPCFKPHHRLWWSKISEIHKDTFEWLNSVSSGILTYSIHENLNDFREFYTNSYLKGRITHCGLDKEYLDMIDSRLNGDFDRSTEDLVPIGFSNSLSLKWDGIDLLETLS